MGRVRCSMVSREARRYTEQPLKVNIPPLNNQIFRIMRLTKYFRPGIVQGISIHTVFVGSLHALIHSRPIPSTVIPFDRPPLRV